MIIFHLRKQFIGWRLDIAFSSARVGSKWCLTRAGAKRVAARIAEACHS